MSKGEYKDGYHGNRPASHYDTGSDAWLGATHRAQHEQSHQAEPASIGHHRSSGIGAISPWFLLLCILGIAGYVWYQGDAEKAQQAQSDLAQSQIFIGNSFTLQNVAVILSSGRVVDIPAQSLIRVLAQSSFALVSGEVLTVCLGRNVIGHLTLEPGRNVAPAIGGGPLGVSHRFYHQDCAVPSR